MPQPSTIWQKILSTPPKPRRNLLLLYLWKQIPATTDAIHFPDDATKIDLYNRFLAECAALSNTDIITVFDAAFDKNSYPWSPGNTLAEPSGQAWAKVFAQAAIKLGVQVRNAKTKTPEEIGKEVRDMVEERVYAEWFPVLDRIFRDAWRLEEAELKDREQAEEGGPGR
jgi:hypothetical protein